MSDFLAIIGIVFCLVGTFFLCWGLIISKEKAVELGVSRFSSELQEKNIELPVVKDRIRQSKNAIWGLSFVFIGSVMQIAAFLLTKK